MLSIICPFHQAIKKFMKRTCTCHGLTGSCTMWTCWKVMPPFVEVSKRLGKKYSSAVRVRVDNDGKSLKPVSRRKVKRRKESTTRRTRSAGSAHVSNVAFDSSIPLQEKRIRRRKKPRLLPRASTMVRRRHRRPLTRKKRLPKDHLIFFRESTDFCKFSRSKGSLGTRGRPCDPNSGHCGYLCCNRGYETANVIETKSCDCLFKFCCDVDCKICTTNTTMYFCK